MNPNLIVYYIINCPIPSKIAIENRYQIDFGNPAKHVMILLLQRISEVSTKLSVHNCLIDHRLNPDKQSQALRNGLTWKKSQKKNKKMLQLYHSLPHLFSISHQHLLHLLWQLTMTVSPTTGVRPKNWYNVSNGDYWYHQRWVSLTQNTSPDGYLHRPTCELNEK